MNSGFSTLQLTFAALALGLSAAHVSAQQSATQPDASQPAAPAPTAFPSSPVQPSEPALTVRNQKALENFEPPADEEYTLGAGDELTLSFAGRPELDGKTAVGPDGVITLRYAGSVHVADLTRGQAEKAITESLAKFYNDLSVTVSIDKYSSNRVRVIGYVQHPGEITFEETPTLLNAIGRAGLITPTVSAGAASSAGSSVSNTGPSVPETCTIYRGDKVAVQVNLRELLMSGNTLADMRLRRNDIVFVPEPRHLFVSVMGQVGKPGSIPLTPESTLTSVLAEAGCCSDNGGYNPRIHLLQRSTGKDIVVEYKKLLTLAGQEEYTLHPGDVIYVPTSGFNKVTGIMQKVSPVATIISIAALVGAG
jgi:polysaccharide export outer membrane protein